MRGYPAVACSVVAFVGGVALTLGLEGQARAVPWYAIGRAAPSERAMAEHPGAVSYDALALGPHYIPNLELATMISRAVSAEFDRADNAEPAGKDDAKASSTYEERPNGVPQDGRPPTTGLDGWGSTDTRWVRTVEVPNPADPKATISLEITTERFYFGDGSSVSRTRVRAPFKKWPRTAPPLGGYNVYWQGAGSSPQLVALRPTKGARDPYLDLVAKHNHFVVQRAGLKDFHLPVVNLSRVGESTTGLLTAVKTELVTPRKDRPRRPAARALVDSGLFLLGETRWVAQSPDGDKPVVAQCSQCFALTPLASDGNGELAAAHPISTQLYRSLREPPPAAQREKLAAAAARGREVRTTQQLARRPYRP